ncbi:MAG: tRNA lysidine(34) synthetase TilS [Pseudomonadota bacterium]
METSAPILLAVSGGSDSLALLHLANAWRKKVSANLKVVTVDHGLRPEAAAEAAFVASVCEGLGIRHLTLAWEGLKPSSGIAEAARQARYMLIEEFALDVGAKTILTGHTQDDQAETVLMRNARKKSRQSRGLAGMGSSMSLAQGTKVIRPLLSVSRKSLREYLTIRGQSWVEDPSNFDTAYERVRARNTLHNLEISHNQISRFASLIGRERIIVSNATHQFLSEHLKIRPGPVFEIKTKALETLAQPVRDLVLQIIIALAGGSTYFTSTKKFIEFITEPSDGASLQRITVGNCVLERHATIIRILRENRNLPTQSVSSGEQTLWDGRLLVHNDTANLIVISALGNERAKIIEEEHGIRLPGKPRSVLASTPIIDTHDGKVLLPFLQKRNSIDGLHHNFVSPAIEHYCPSFDYPLLTLMNSVRSTFRNELPLVG